MARIPGVSPSGFHAWFTREPPSRSVNDQNMNSLIRIAYKSCRGTYGPRRIQTALQATGTYLGRDQIGGLRRKMGLRFTQECKFEASTNSAHSLAVVENLLDPQSDVTDSGPVCGTGTTYIWTDEGWPYLASVKDLETEGIIGHAMTSRIIKASTHTLLDRPVRYHKPEPGCVHPSDRGSQYCARIH